MRTGPGARRIEEISAAGNGPAPHMAKQVFLALPEKPLGEETMPKPDGRITDQNPMGTDGFEFVEFAAPEGQGARMRDYLEKLGFTEIGVARRYLHIAGEWRDHRIFQVLVEDVPGGLVERLGPPPHL